MPDTFLFPLQDHVGEAPHDDAGRSSDHTPQRQVMAQHTPSCPRTSMETLRALLLDSTAPFADAYERYSSDEAAHIAKYGYESILGDGEPEADFSVICKRFRDAAAAAQPPATLRDALAVIRYARDDEDEDVAPITLDTADKLRLLQGAYSTVAAVMEARSAFLIKQANRSVLLVAQGATVAPDAELLSSAARAQQIYDEMNDTTVEDDVPDEVVTEYNRLINTIAELPAHTTEGVAAKLRFFTYEVEGCVYSYISHGRTEGLLPQFIRTALEGAQRLTCGAVVFADPDAELLSVYRTFVDAYRQIEDIGDEKDPRFEAVCDAKYGAWDRIESLMPQTAAGMAAHLKLILHDTEETLQVDRALFYGEPLENGYQFACSGGGMLWKLIQHLECGSRLNIAAPAPTQQPDAFADTITAFQGEAEKALSLPTAPTVNMLEAGAAAAGIDIQQARAIYAAMADAYKKEAA
ncbi:hypothetical protein FBZ83_11717 [Azospirillum brasilense]|uniref:Uncharacterized protein n=2 Tax=Azospirillum brasilense TaxID=192 RepID=A0A560BW82_AZOBR|nr:hypothetical protein FBZ83_11717 [Azospirillum brasilense]